MDIGSLPLEVVASIFRDLPLRSQIRFASTCKAFKDVFDHEVRALHPSFHRKHQGVVQWMLRNPVRMKLESLHGRWCFFGPCGWISSLERLQKVTMSYCRLTKVLLWKLPTSLRYVDLHRIVPSPGEHALHIVMFGLLPNLQELKLTVHPSWRMVTVGSLPPSLSLLHIRCASKLVILDDSVRDVDCVHLHARHALVCNSAFRGCTSLTLRCDNDAVPLEACLPARGDRLYKLSVSSANGDQPIPSLAPFTNLKALTLCLDSVNLDQHHLNGMVGLETLHIEARFAWRYVSDGQNNNTLHFPPTCKSILVSISHVRVI